MLTPGSAHPEHVAYIREEFGAAEETLAAQRADGLREAGYSICIREVVR